MRANNNNNNNNRAIQDLGNAPSGKEPLESVWKEEVKRDGRDSSVCNIQADQSDLLLFSLASSLRLPIGAMGDTGHASLPGG